jgi:hypothetical protein
MIQEHNKAVIPDASGHNDLEVEMNWNDKTHDAVRIKLGDKEAIIKIDDLFGLAYTLASPEQQAELMPVRHTTVTKYFKQHVVKAKRDIKKGDQLIVNCEINVPTVVEDGLRRDIFKKKGSMIFGVR